MVTCQSSELGWEVTVELPTDFLSLGRGSVIKVYVGGYKDIYGSSGDKVIDHVSKFFLCDNGL